MLNYGKFVKPPLIIFICLVSLIQLDNSCALAVNEIAKPPGIVINEILPSPEGPDEKEEWIEIFNQNDFEAVLSGWQIKDLKGKIKTYTFPDKTTIPQKGFLILSRPETKITLNNNGDGLNLIQPNGKILDTVSYEKAPRGESYNKTKSGWAWSNILTPGSANIVPTSQAPGEKENAETGSPQIKEPKSQKQLGILGLGAVGDPFRQIPDKPLLPFLVALAIAISSGGIILILKKQLKNFDLSKKLE